MDAVNIIYPYLAVPLNVNNPLSGHSHFRASFSSQEAPRNYLIINTLKIN